MRIRKYRHEATLAEFREGLPATISWELRQPRVPMQHSATIEVDGVFLGVAVEHELGVRFIAIHAQVKDMDQSIWPTIQYAQRSARQLFRTPALFK
jgi:hypothetical protein